MVPTPQLPLEYGFAHGGRTYCRTSILRSRAPSWSGSITIHSCFVGALVVDILRAAVTIEEYPDVRISCGVVRINDRLTSIMRLRRRWKLMVDILMLLLARRQFPRGAETAGRRLLGALKTVGCAPTVTTFSASDTPMHQQYPPYTPITIPSDKKPIIMADKAMALKEEGNK